MKSSSRHFPWNGREACRPCRRRMATNWKLPLCTLLCLMNPLPFGGQILAMMDVPISDSKKRMATNWKLPSLPISLSALWAHFLCWLRWTHISYIKHTSYGNHTNWKLPSQPISLMNPLPFWRWQTLATMDKCLGVRFSLYRETCCMATNWKLPSLPHEPTSFMWTKFWQWWTYPFLIHWNGWQPTEGCPLSMDELTSFIWANSSNYGPVSWNWVFIVQVFVLREIWFKDSMHGSNLSLLLLGP